MNAARYRVVPVRLLGRGRHASPRAGGCLLEVVGALVGGAWTDHPAPVNRTLGVLARAVNDAMSDESRPSLAPLVPFLAVPVAPTDTEVGAEVARLAANSALLGADPPAPERAALLEWAGPIRPRPSGPAWRRPWQERALARSRDRAVRQAVTCIARYGRDPDDELRALLAQAMDRARGPADALPFRPADLDADACRIEVPVRTSLRAPDGGDSLSLHVEAMTDEWPSWLAGLPMGRARSKPIDGRDDQPGPGRPRSLSLYFHVPRTRLAVVRR